MKLLFSSVSCLLDRSSGAAISVRTILKLLAAQGVDCRAFTGSCYDSPESPDSLENLRRSGAAPTDTWAPVNKPWEMTDGGVRHAILPMQRPARAQQSHQDEERLLAEGEAYLESYEPDALMIYGGSIFEHGIVAAAGRRGIATLFYLANPGYTTAAAFQGIDQIFCDSQATAELYRERLALDTMVIGKFIEPPLLPEHAGPRQYVTFVNPAAPKGVTLFYRIAELAAQVAPQLKFLVVESRATLEEAEQRTGMRFSQLPNIRRVGLQSDMGAVFAETRILLFPALWHESGARCAIEAAAHGIPTVATNRGGIPEVLGPSGILIEPPGPLVRDHWLIPPLTEAMPWVESLLALTEDAAFYHEHSALAREAWKAHDPAGRIARIITTVEELVARKARAA